MSIEKEVDDLIESSKYQQHMPNFNYSAEALGFKLHEETVLTDLNEDLSLLLNGSELSEEFKANAAIVFESVVKGRVKKEVQEIENDLTVKVNEYMEYVNEQMEVDMQQHIEDVRNELAEDVEKYIEYAVSQYIEDNSEHFTYRVKADINESFVNELKAVFNRHNMAIPESDETVVSKLQEQVSFLENKLDNSLDKCVKLRNELKSKEKQNIVELFTENMTINEKEKFKTLAEDLDSDYIDNSEYSRKLSSIKESFFGKKPTYNLNSVVTDEPVNLQETVKYSNDKISRYVETLNKIK